MALSGSITLDRSQTQVNQKVRAVLVVSNSDMTNAITVLNVAPFVKSAVAANPNSLTAAIGQCLSNQPVPPSGSITLVWDMMFETGNPTSNYDSQPSANNYDVGCLIYGDDGSINSPTVQTVSVRPSSNYGS